jgi:acyl-CoA synthetase (NDP forming)
VRHQLADAADHEHALRLLSSSGTVDAIVVIYERPLRTVTGEFEEAIAAGAGDRSLPVLVVSPRKPALRGGSGLYMASFDFPEDGARALGQAAGYASWRAAARGVVPELAGLQVDAARAEILQSLAHGPGWMPLEAVERLLRCYGTELVETRFARSTHEAGRAASDLAGPVALKAVVPGLRHVSGVGGVRLGLTGRRDVSRAADEKGVAGLR